MLVTVAPAQISPLPSVSCECAPPVSYHRLGAWRIGGCLSQYKALLLKGSGAPETPPWRGAPHRLARTTFGTQHRASQKGQLLHSLERLGTGYKCLVF